MIKEPQEMGLKPILSHSPMSTELALLLFIAIFAFLGLLICINFNLGNQKNLTYLPPSIIIEQNLT